MNEKRFLDKSQPLEIGKVVCKTFTDRILRSPFSVDFCRQLLSFLLFLKCKLVLSSYKILCDV